MESFVVIVSLAGTAMPMVPIKVWRGTEITGMSFKGMKNDAPPLIGMQQQNTAMMQLQLIRVR